MRETEKTDSNSAKMKRVAYWALGGLLLFLLNAAAIGAGLFMAARDSGTARTTVRGPTQLEEEPGEDEITLVRGLDLSRAGDLRISAAEIYVDDLSTLALRLQTPGFAAVSVQPRPEFELEREMVPRLGPSPRLGVGVAEITRSVSEAGGLGRLREITPEEPPPRRSPPRSIPLTVVQPEPRVGLPSPLESAPSSTPSVPLEYNMSSSAEPAAAPELLSNPVDLPSIRAPQKAPVLESPAL